LIDIKEKLNYIRDNSELLGRNKYRIWLFGVIQQEINNRESENDFDRGYIQGLMYVNSVMRRNEP